jgi:pyrroloquinoline quinone biosynthesis protein D
MTELQSTTIDQILVPATDVEVEIVDGEVLLYHPQKTRAVYLNPTAAVVWGLCDGSRSVREIIRLIGESYPDAGSLTDDVLATLNQLQESGVLVVR